MGFGKVTALSLMGAVCLCGAAHAQEAAINPSLSKTWVADIGIVFHSLDGDLSAVTAGGQGGSYNLSRLGLDDQDTSISVNVLWRFSKSWRLDLGYDEVNSSGHAGNNSSIDFGHITIPAGYEIGSSLDLRTYSAFLGYAFSQSSNYELGGRFGLNIMDTSASVGGRTFVGPSEIIVGPQKIGSTTFVPTVGLFATYAFDDRLAFEGSIDGIAGSVDIYSGHYLKIESGLKYWFTDSFAIGGGYRYVDIKVDRDGSAIDSGIDVDSHSGFIKASMGF